MISLSTPREGHSFSIIFQLRKENVFEEADKFKAGRQIVELKDPKRELLVTKWLLNCNYSFTKFSKAHVRIHERGMFDE